MQNNVRDDMAIVISRIEGSLEKNTKSNVRILKVAGGQALYTIASAGALVLQRFFEGSIQVAFASISSSMKLHKPVELKDCESNMNMSTFRTQHCCMRFKSPMFVVTTFNICTDFSHTVRSGFFLTKLHSQGKAAMSQIAFIISARCTLETCST